MIQQLFFQLLAYSESLTDQVGRDIVSKISSSVDIVDKTFLFDFLENLDSFAKNVMHYLTVFFSQRINLDEKSFFTHFVGYTISQQCCFVHDAFRNNFYEGI